MLVGAKSLFWVNFCHYGELKFENGDKKMCFSSVLVVKFQISFKKNRHVLVLSFNRITNK